MTVKVTKPAVNLREKLAEVDKPSGIAGEAMLRAETPQEQFNLIGAGRKNLIINGAMQVSQRGTSTSGLSTTTGYYGPDRFQIETGAGADGVYTISQSSNAPSEFYNSYRLETTTANTTNIYTLFGQKIEAPSLRHLKYGTADAKSVTLSFWVKSSETGDLSIEFLNRATGGSDRSIGRYITIQSADTWEKHSVTIEGDTVGSFIEDNSSLFVIFFGKAQSYFQSSAFNEQWQTRNTSSICTANNINVFGGVGRYIEITGVQLELGKVATPFEHRSYGEELALCQRYFQKFPINDDDINAISGTIQATNGSCSFNYFLVKPTRVSPTVTVNGTGTGDTSSPAANEWAVYVNGAYKAAGTVAVSGGPTVDAIRLNISTSGTTGGQAASVYLGPGAGLSIDAEL